MIKIKTEEIEQAKKNIAELEKTTINTIRINQDMGCYNAHEVCTLHILYGNVIFFMRKFIEEKEQLK